MRQLRCPGGMWDGASAATRATTHGGARRRPSGSGCRRGVHPAATDPLAPAILRRCIRPSHAASCWRPLPPRYSRRATLRRRARVDARAPDSRRRAKRCRSSAWARRAPSRRSPNAAPGPSKPSSARSSSTAAASSTPGRAATRTTARSAHHQRAGSARAPVRHDQSRAAGRAGRPRAFRAHVAPLSARDASISSTSAASSTSTRNGRICAPSKTRARRATSASRPRRPRSTGSSKRSSQRERPDFVEINYSVTERDAERLLPLLADRGIAVLISRPFMNGAYFERLANVPLPPWAAEFECDELGAVLAAIHLRESGRHLRADRDDERRAHGRERARGVRFRRRAKRRARGCERSSTRPSPPLSTRAPRLPGTASRRQPRVPPIVMGWRKLSTPTLGAFPSSPYAAELRRGPGSRSFAPPLEAEFARLHLGQMRTLIRVTSLLALLLAGARGTEQILAAAWNPLQLGQFAVVLASSALLAAMAWGPWFARLYLPFAQVLVPVRNALVAVTVAGRCGGGTGRGAHAAAAARHRAVFRARTALPRRARRGGAHVGRVRRRQHGIRVGVAVDREIVRVVARRRGRLRSRRARRSREPRARASSKAISSRSLRSAMRLPAS